MTEEEFLQLTPWLTTEKAAQGIERARDDLAQFYGVGWYAAPDTVAEFFRYLNTGDRTVALLAELPSVGDSADRQVTWLGSVVAEIDAAVRASQQAASQQVTSQQVTSQQAASQQAPAQAAYTEPEYDPAYQLYYRYNHRAAAYEWSADPASGQWMNQARADEHARAAAAQAQQLAQAQQSAQAQQQRYSAPEWDANAGLYYRYDYVDGTYEWSADGIAGWAGAQRPAAQEPVPQQAPPAAQEPVPQQAPPPAPEQAPPPAPAPTEEMVAEVAAKRADAVAATIAEIRDAGVGSDEMSDEEIEAMFDQTVLESS